MDINHLCGEFIKKKSPLVLELGCGDRKRIPGSVGIDVLDYPAVDLVGDVIEVLSGFPENSVDKVYSHHFVEHIKDIGTLMTELARITKEGGEVEFVAPHFSNPYFYSDPTHQRFFGLYTFCYFSQSSIFKRDVPTYKTEIRFELERVDLNFKSTRPFYGRHAFKKIIGEIFNSCTYLKELYEENFCYLFPCYEVRYVLRRL